MPRRASPVTLDPGSQRKAQRRRSHFPGSVMSRLLEGWGRQVYRLRWWLLALSLVSLAPAFVVVAHGARAASAPILTTTESGRAATLMARALSARPRSFDPILSHPTLRATAPAFKAAATRALPALGAAPRVARVRPPYDLDPSDQTLIWRDGHRIRGVVELKQRRSAVESLEFSSLPPGFYPSLRAKVSPSDLEVVAAGPLVLHHDFIEVAQRDLRR